VSKNLHYDQDFIIAIFVHDGILRSYYVDGEGKM